MLKRNRRQIIGQFVCSVGQTLGQSQGQNQNQVPEEELHITHVAADAVQEGHAEVLDHSVKPNEFETLNHSCQGAAAFEEKQRDAGDVLDLA